MKIFSVQRGVLKLTDWSVHSFIKKFLGTNSISGYCTRFMGDSKKDLEGLLALEKLIMWLGKHETTGGCNLIHDDVWINIGDIKWRK